MRTEFENQETSELLPFSDILVFWEFPEENQKQQLSVESLFPKLKIFDKDLDGRKESTGSRQKSL